MNLAHWYYVHLRWAVMVEGKEGLRHWIESVHIFRSATREQAFRQALQMGYAKEGRSKEGRRLIEHRFAEVLMLDSVGTDPRHFEVNLGRKRPGVHLPFEHVFCPEGSNPEAFF